MIETCRSVFKSFNIKLSVCIGWCADRVTLRSARRNDKDCHKCTVSTQSTGNYRQILETLEHSNISETYQKIKFHVNPSGGSRDAPCGRTKPLYAVLRTRLQTSCKTGTKLCMTRVFAAFTVACQSVPQLAQKGQLKPNISVGSSKFARSHSCCLHLNPLQFIRLASLSPTHLHLPLTPVTSYHHHHPPPWIRSFDPFRHRSIAVVSWGVHVLFFLEVCSWRRVSGVWCCSGVPRGVWCVQPPRNSESLPKSCQTQPDLWKLSKIAEFRTPTPQDVRKKGSKILKLPRFAIVLH